MFQRFAASTAVASIAIAIAALIVCFAPGLTFERIYPSHHPLVCRSRRMGNLGIADTLGVDAETLATLGSASGAHCRIVGGFRPEPAFPVFRSGGLAPLAWSSGSRHGVVLLLALDAGARSLPIAGIDGTGEPAVTVPEAMNRAEFQPAYLGLWRSGELARRGELGLEKLADCALCPRNCHVNRIEDEDQNVQDRALRRRQ